MKRFSFASVAIACMTAALPASAKNAPPAPAGASQILQEAIKSTPGVDLDAHRAMNNPDWSALRAARASDIPSADALSEMFGVAIHEQTLAGVRTYRVQPKQIAPAFEERLFMHIHGGAYVFYTGEQVLLEAVLIAANAGIEVVSVDYRLAPEHPFPAAQQDAYAVYTALLDDHPASHIAIGGTSAGGGLTLSLAHHLKKAGKPMPAALFAGSPWADLSKTGDTLYTLEGLDAVLGTYDGLLEAAARAYAGKTDLKDPGVSPVYGDFSDFAPVFLVSGTRDMLLSDTARTHQHLRNAGVHADLVVIEGMSHADYLFYLQAPETQSVFRDLTAFLEQYLAPEAN